MYKIISEYFEPTYQNFNVVLDKGLVLNTVYQQY